MGKTILKANVFSVKELKKLKNDLQKYRDSLPGKCEEIVKRLSDLGEEVALQKINESPLGKKIDLQSTRTREEMGCKAILVATGEIQESEGHEPFNLLFAVEFGAGIHHNPIPNPKANEFGMGVGTFPGQIHAFEDGWYYLGEDDQWHYTRGVKATMPMYNASMEIVQNIERVVKEVFG